MKPDKYLPPSFQMLFDNAQMAAIILMDEKGVIITSNTGVLKSYGYLPEDLTGKHFSILFTEEDRMKNLPEIEITRVHQKHCSTDRNYIVHKDGSSIWSHGETIFTKNDKGDIILVKLIYDINAQKLQESYLLKANEELKRINSELDNFVYSASHDLKAPIANIEALLDTLEDDLSTESKKQISEVLEMLRISVHKFKSTISDLTTAGRELAAGKKKTECKFAEVVEEIKTGLHEEIEKSSAVFIENFYTPVINISKKDIRSILYNLISNAIKYRSPERKPEVKLTTKKADDTIIIEVSDNGLGIKKEDHEKVFDMYTRLHTHVEGTGVGMNIVKKIVEAYQGKVEIESEPGEGSTFKIYIPN